MKKVTISSHAQGGLPWDDWKSFTVDNEGEVTVTLSPLDIKHITEALSEYNRKFYGPWEQKPNGNYWHKMTKANRQIGYIIRKLYLAAKSAFLKEGEGE